MFGCTVHVEFKQFDIFSFDIPIILHYKTFHLSMGWLPRTSYLWSPSNRVLMKLLYMDTNTYTVNKCGTVPLQCCGYGSRRTQIILRIQIWFKKPWMRIQHIVFKENRHKKLPVYQYPKSWNFLNFITGANSFFYKARADQNRPGSATLTVMMEKFLWIININSIVPGRRAPSRPSIQRRYLHQRQLLADWEHVWPALPV